MARYFRTIPTMRYETFDGSGQTKVVTNIFTRVRAKLATKKDRVVYYNYELIDGQTPEIVSWKYYGSTNYTWVVLLFNDILDPKFDWLLTSRELESYIKNKHGSVEAALTGSHHYETKQILATASGYGYNVDDVVLEKGIEVSYDFTFSYGTGVSPYSFTKDESRVLVTTYEYEEAQNEKKRSIKLLRRDFLDQFVTEFEELVRSKVR